VDPISDLRRRAALDRPTWQARARNRRESVGELPHLGVRWIRLDQPCGAPGIVGRYHQATKRPTIDPTAMKTRLMPRCSPRGAGVTFTQVPGGVPAARFRSLEAAIAVHIAQGWVRIILEPRPGALVMEFICLRSRAPAGR
jgi:hypothetical protein